MSKRKATMVIQSTDDLFEQLLGDIQPTEFAKKVYPNFRLRVGVIKYRPPRHEFFEFIRDMGLNNIDRVMNHQSFRGDSLAFVFPERWMGIQESTHFMSRLAKHPDVLADKIKRVDILTSSPHMISDFPNCLLRIIDFGHFDDPYNCTVRFH